MLGMKKRKKRLKRKSGTVSKRLSLRGSRSSRLSSLAREIGHTEEEAELEEVGEVVV